MSEDHLLDDTILVPQTQPSPHSFSTQLVKRLRIKSFTNRRGDAVNPNTNNTDENNEAGPSTSGVASLSDQALKSIELNLTTPLRPILKDKAKAVSKYEFLRHCAAIDYVPKGVLPIVPLKITDPPTPLKEQWNETIVECGNKLLRILIEFHLSQIKSKEEMAQDIITRASHIILPEFVADVPNIGDKIEETIEDLLVETNRSTKKIPRKRKSETPNTTLAPKKQKKTFQKNGKSSSTEEVHKRKNKSLKLQKKTKKD